MIRSVDFYADKDEMLSHHSKYDEKNPRRK